MKLMLLTDYAHLLLFVLIFSLGCATNQPNTSQPTNESIWKVEAQEFYNSNDAVSVLLTNTSGQSLTILDPLMKYVEQNVDGNWNRVNILYCGCGGCPPPPESMDVSAGESYSFSWDQQEETCINGNLNRKPSEKGQYRVVIRYFSNPREVKKLYVPFAL